jgi:hypothetical protein
MVSRAPAAQAGMVIHAIRHEAIPIDPGKYFRRHAVVVAFAARKAAQYHQHQHQRLQLASHQNDPQIIIVG